MELSRAKSKAETLVNVMRPFCQRIEIAGSIRRKKAEVKDIEIVAIPRLAYVPVPLGLFEEGEKECNLLYEWALGTEMVRWIKPGVTEIIDWQPKGDGKYWRGLLDNEIKLDLFLTTPEGWGTIFLIRTGSAEFSHAVAAHAQRIGRPIAGGRLTIAGVPIETPEEEDVFRHLRLAYVAPQARFDRSAITEIINNNGSSE